MTARKRRLSRRRLRHHDRTEKFSVSFNANLRRKQYQPGKKRRGKPVGSVGETP